jgi:hypothetical protein
MPAPIALFAYNRPLHTRRTVESLLGNELAAQSDLFVFSDAAKNGDAIPAVEEVRVYVRGIRGFRSVTIVERERNCGLAKSIIGGVTRLSGEFGRVIVLEDDLVTSPYFLKYMNDGLDRYEDCPRVMHISGCTYPVRVNESSDSYFLRLPLCWGWATWRRAWAQFSKDINVMKQFDRGMIYRFNFDGTYDYWKQLQLNRAGAIDTWFVFWYATVFLNDGLVLFPRQSLVRNIGMDGTGVHCGTTNDFDTEVSRDPIELSSIAMEESRAAFADHKTYFRRIFPPLYTRAVRKLARPLKSLLAR